MNYMTGIEIECTIAVRKGEAGSKDKKAENRCTRRLSNKKMYTNYACSYTALILYKHFIKYCISIIYKIP